MRSTMMLPPTSTEIPTSSPAWLAELTPEVLAVLGITDTHDLFAPRLSGESAAEAAGRLAAASDILDDRLEEIAHHALTPEVIEGWAR